MCLCGVSLKLNETPKAFANLSPGFEEREPWVCDIKRIQTLKGFANCVTLSGLLLVYPTDPQGCRKLQPWAEISERLRRFMQFQN